MSIKDFNILLSFVKVQHLTKTCCFSLETNGKLMELDHQEGKLKVNYGDRLVTLLREVRQLTGLGFPIPAKILHVAKVAQKFYRHGIILKQVSKYVSEVSVFLK